METKFYNPKIISDEECDEVAFPEETQVIEKFNSTSSNSAIDEIINANHNISLSENIDANNLQQSINSTDDIENLNHEMALGQISNKVQSNNVTSKKRKNKQTNLDSEITKKFEKQKTIEPTLNLEKTKKFEKQKKLINQKKRKLKKFECILET